MTTPRDCVGHRQVRRDELTSSRIKAHATKLGLPHLAASLDQLCKRADVEQLGYLDFLDLIIEEELGIREGRRFRAALRLSKLPHHKTIDEFDFSFQPDLDNRKIRDLATLSFIDTKSNVALLGPPGVGKTHLAVGLAVAACRAGYSTYFTNLTTWSANSAPPTNSADSAGRCEPTSARPSS